MDIQNKDRVDVILANPPFGGGEQVQVQENFPIKSGESAYLFLQHFIKKLKAGGRAGIIIKDTFLSNSDAKLLRKELLETCKLHSILNLPRKVFTAGIKTIVLFFEKGTSTKKIFYYDLNLDRNLGLTNPLTENDLKEFVDLYTSKKEGPNSWLKNINDIDKETWDLTVKNPSIVEKTDERKPEEIIIEIENLDKKTSETLKKIKELL
jgi:type I restriction enzyme M protein